MTRPSFRVFVTKHHGGLTSAVLLRRYRVLFDPPPPAAMAADEETALTRLAPQAALIAEDAETAARYLWSEQLELRRVDVDIHPGRPDPRGYVIAGATVPIRLGYAAAPLAKAPGDPRLWRVIVPRFDWSFVAEDLDAVPDTVRALVFSSLIGDAPASLYDLRREVAETIVEWSPLSAAARAQGRTAHDADPAPTLEAVAEDWVALARAGRLPPVVGVDPVYDELASLLDDDRAPSMLFVGPRGAGKTALVRRIARGLMERSRGKRATQRRLWATSADRIVAGMVYLGMWQQRCLSIAKELEGGSDVLYVDRLADAMAPMHDGATITDLLAPAILAGELSLFAECDEAELVRARQKHPALLDALRIVRVPEASPAQVIALLEPYGQRLAPPVALSHEAARRLVELCAAFRRDTAFPGKAVQFVSYCSLHGHTRLSLRELTVAFGAWSGLPVDLLAPERALDTAAIAAQLRVGVVGQDAACHVAARVIARLKAGLDDPQRPVGALLFAGPTGVGKTELAKQLARYLFGDADRLVRVDMSEITTPAAIARMITPSPAGTSLADRIRRQPLSVVLFDEIEKADDAAFDLLLGVLGEGRLTDALGRLIDFRMALIVLTTNLGAADPRPAGFSSQPDIADERTALPFGSAAGRARVPAGERTALPFGSAAGRARVPAGGPTSAIKAFFRPELIGRLDTIVAFSPLPPAALERIVDLELAKLRARPGFVARNLRLELSAAARTRLASLGHDVKLGARPLRRTIEDLIVAPLAERMARDPAWRDAVICVAAHGEPGDIFV